MINIRLLYPLRFDHIELSSYEVIGVRVEIADEFVRLGIAEYAEPQKAVVAPEETRVERPLARAGRRPGNANNHRSN